MSTTSERISIKTRVGETLDVAFGEANAAQKLQSQKLTHRTWASQVPEADFLYGDTVMCEAPLFHDDGCRFWCLYKADAPDEVVAACRTYRRDMLLRDGQGTRQVQSYAINTVATDVTYRGCGLASFLMTKVADWLDSPEGGNAEFTFLYTVVGQFYVKTGWELLPSPQITIDLPTEMPADWAARLESGASKLKTELVKPSEVAELCKRDVEYLRGQVEKHDLATDTVLVSPLPTPEVLDWLQKRASLLLRLVPGPAGEREITSQGAVCKEADTWILWYHNAVRQNLFISRVKLGSGDRAKTVQALVQLLRQALKEMDSWDGLMDHIVIWDPSPEIYEALEILKEELGVTTRYEERTGNGANQTSVRWPKESKKTVFWPNEHFSSC